MSSALTRPAAALVVLAALAVPACASQHGWYRYPQGPTHRPDTRAFDNGYRRGYDDGARDARRGRRFDYARHDEYRDADRGYADYSTRGAYRRVFRDGYVSGYRDGYRSYARVGRDRYGDLYPSDRRGGDPGWSGDHGVWRSPAADHGYRDGYAQGRDDARDRDRYDPVRASRYRSGDAGYHGRYGSRDDYKRDYRIAFQEGYDRGYRDGR